MMQTLNREGWLTMMIERFIADHFTEAGYTVPDKVRVTCGWPHKGGVGSRKRRIGECWSPECSTDGSHQIFISPVLDEPVKVIGVLIHEVVHAVVGVEHGHKKPFSTCAKAVGLTPKWTSTGESEELVATIKGWLAKSPAYSHSMLDKNAVKEQKAGTRMLKMECECGLIVRTTQKWLDEYGETGWPCPCGGTLNYAG